LKLEAETFKALSDPRRLKIIKLLSHREMCVCEINLVLHISQPAVSHHLNILEKAGLIQSDRKGKWVFYSLKDKKVLALMEKARKLIQP
jgi:ArsR family transcriptional regulator